MSAQASGIRVEDLAQSTGELLVRVAGDASISVSGLAFDSGRVTRGDLFFCVPGSLTDGHLFAEAAVGSGAAALCVERSTGAGVPEIVVSDSRRAMGRISAAFYGHPSDKLLLVGVTGTNGKTTTAYLLESILAAAGHRPGLIGTIEVRFGGESRPGVRTTPESVDLHSLFSDMLDENVDSVAMEVTSHALALHRVEAVRFASAAFTNLSQDHLDFHSSMEDYFDAKRSLFSPERLDRAVINIDDEWGRRLRAEVNIETIGFGLSRSAEVRAEDVRFGSHASEFVLVSPEGRARVTTPLIGSFNVSNCLAAAAVALQAGIGIEATTAGLASLQSVPGRFEAVDEGQPFAVIIDYAHTPDSLENVLRASRDLASRRDGKLICVFGCGGDRDRGKRPVMGAVAARLADYVVVTSDNPRSEDPQSIIDSILRGVVAERGNGPDAVLVNRSEAITHAVKAAGERDVVIIAGKGHERGQEFRDVTIPFDDRIVARQALNELGWNA